MNDFSAQRTKERKICVICAICVTSLPSRISDRYLFQGKKLARIPRNYSNYSYFFQNFLVTLHAKALNNEIMEARTTTYPQEGQLLVKISDMSMMKDIKKAISMVKGVENVTQPRRKRISAYERSLRDLEEGRVYEAKDVDDLFRQCLG